MHITSLLMKQMPGLNREAAAATAADGFQTRLNQALQKVAVPVKIRRGVPVAAAENGRADSAHYLDVLHKSLLTKGKRLDQMFIEREDLPAVTDFLERCGFAQQDIARFTRDVLPQLATERIRMSDVFRQLRQIKKPADKKASPAVLDAAAVPHVESILRAFDLAPQTVDRILAQARSGDGGLDLVRLVENLKKVDPPSDGAATHVIGAEKFQRALAAMEDLGLPAPALAKSVRMSLDEFADALKRAANPPRGTVLPVRSAPAAGDRLEQVRPDKGQPPVSTGKNVPDADARRAPGMLTAEANPDRKVPADIEAAIGRIVEKTMLAGQPDSLEPAMDLSKITVAAPAAGSKAPPQGRSAGREARAAAGVEKPAATGEPQAMKTAAPPGEEATPARFPAAEGGAREAAPATVDQHEWPDVKPAAALPAGAGAGSGRADVPPPLMSRPQPQSPGVLPNYLIDQVSRQISQSLSRGDGTVRFQLRPPEIGAVKLELKLKDNLLKLGVVTENSSVKELMLSNIQELKHTLTDQGIRLDRLEVHIQNDANPSRPDLAEGFTRDGRSDGGRKTEDPFGGDDEAPVAAMAQSVTLNQDYLLDLMA